MKTISLKLKQKLNEVYLIEPNDVGISYLTFWYKRTTRYLKNLPFIIIIPLSFIFALFAYLILGQLLVRLVTLLQYGF